MMIDKINGINPLSNLQNAKKAEVVVKYNAGTDVISVSDEARVKAEAYYLQKIADETPDVRVDRVAELKVKIKDSAYLTNVVINSAAEGIMASFGL